MERGGVALFKNSILPEIMWEKQDGYTHSTDTKGTHSVIASVSVTHQHDTHSLDTHMHCRSKSAHVVGSPRMTFSMSKVISLEMTPCTAACVPVPAVLVVCPAAGVLFWSSNIWSGVLGVTRVNKEAGEQCVSLMFSVCYHLSQIRDSVSFRFICHGYF